MLKKQYLSCYIFNNLFITLYFIPLSSRTIFFEMKSLLVYHCSFLFIVLFQVFVALGFVLVTSVQLTTAEPKSSKEDESESKTPNVVAPFVLRKLLTWISTDEGWMSSGDFFGPPPDEERTDKRRPSEKSNATKSSETPSRRGSFREKRIAFNIMIKVGSKRENKTKTSQRRWKQPKFQE